MRRVSLSSVTGPVSDLVARVPRPSAPAFVTRKRTAVAGGGLLLIAGAAVAYVLRPRAERGTVAVKTVVDGPDGYVLVVTDTFTFLVPASLRPYFEYCAKEDEQASYVLGRQTVDGVRVGSVG